MNNNNLIRLLVFVAVMAMLISVTSTVLGYELLPVNITAENVYVGSADIVLSVEAPEGATIKWYKEVYGSGEGAKVISGATEASYALTETDTSATGLVMFYAEVNGAKSELIKITVVKAPYAYTKSPINFRFDSETEMNDHTGSVANSEKSIATLDDGKKVLMVRHTTGNNDVNIRFTNFAVPVADYKIAVYKIMPMIDGNRNVVLYPTYDDKLGPYNTDSGYFQKNIGRTGANGQWQYIVDEDITYLDGGVMSDGFPNGPTLFNGGRLDYYNDSPGIGSVMYIESVMFFATQQDCDEYIAKDKSNNVTEQPDNLDMVAWEFKNDPAFAATFLPDTDVTDGANLKAGVKTTTSLMSRNKFDLDRYSVVKVLGATEGTITFYDGETELGKINLAEGNVANFSNKADFPNWKGEFTNLKIEASQDMTVTAIAFFVSEENAKLYTAKAYFCDECGQAPCVCPTKPLKYEDAVWWNFGTSAVFNTTGCFNAAEEFVKKSDSEIAHAQYTVKNNMEFSLKRFAVNMISEHVFEACKYPFIKIGYKYSNAEAKNAYIKFTTDRSEDVIVNFELAATDTDTNGYSVIALDFSSLTSLKAIDASVNDEFRGEIESFEFGIEDAKVGDVLDMAYILFFKDDAQAGEFDGELIERRCGDNITWLVDENGILKIDGTGAMYNSYNWVDYNDISWETFTDEIVGVEISEGVTTIGNMAFAGFENLKSVVFADESKLESIGEGAFNGCISLESIAIPENVTSICAEAFRKCRSLKSVNFEGESKLDSIGDMAFSGCIALESIEIPNGVTTLGEGAFNECYELKKVTFGKNSKLKYIFKMAFYYCNSLECVILPESLTDIGQLAFGMCDALEEIYIPESVKNIYSGFSDSYSVIIYCSEDSYAHKYAVANGYRYRINDCGENAAFTPLTVDGVMYIKGTGDMTNWECDLDVPWYDMRDKISKVVIEEGITSVGDYAFDFCKALTSVELPDGITYIGDYAFDFCINLKEITLPYGVKTIGESAFEYCRSLTELVVPQSVDAVKDYAFNDCRKLKTVYYAGDETAFNSVNIGKENDALTDADFVYSSNGPVPAVLSVDKSAVILYEGEKVTLTATLDSDISDDVIWFSDNEKIATVENGVVTAKRAGEVTITAVAENNRSTKANCLVKVEHLYGDTTLDGSINVSDAILLLQHLASSNIILGPKD